MCVATTPRGVPAAGDNRSAETQVAGGAAGRPGGAAVGRAAARQRPRGEGRGSCAHPGGGPRRQVPRLRRPVGPGPPRPSPRRLPPARCPRGRHPGLFPAEPNTGSTLSLRPYGELRPAPTCPGPPGLRGGPAERAPLSPGEPAAARPDPGSPACPRPASPSVRGAPLPRGRCLLGPAGIPALGPSRGSLSRRGFSCGAGWGGPHKRAAGDRGAAACTCAPRFPKRQQLLEREQTPQVRCPSLLSGFSLGLRSKSEPPLAWATGQASGQVPVPTPCVRLAAARGRGTARGAASAPVEERVRAGL